MIDVIFHFSRFSRKPLSWVDREKLGLAQYYMVNWSHGQAIGTTRRTGNPLNMSTVFFEFSFQRRTGFFLLQVNQLYELVVLLLYKFLTPRVTLSTILLSYEILFFRYTFR